MKITIKHKGTEITIEEAEMKDNLTSLKWSDQCKYVQETIASIIDNINSLGNEKADIQ